MFIFSWNHTSFSHKTSQFWSSQDSQSLDIHHATCTSTATQNQQNVWSHLNYRGTINFPHSTHIFLTDGALLAVVGIGDPWPPAYGTSTLVGAVVTLITDSDQCTGTHIRVTHYTQTIIYGIKNVRVIKLTTISVVKIAIDCLRFSHNLPMAVKKKKKIAWDRLHSFLR